MITEILQLKKNFMHAWESWIPSIVKVTLYNVKTKHSDYWDNTIEVYFSLV